MRERRMVEHFMRKTSWVVRDLSVFRLFEPAIAIDGIPGGSGRQKEAREGEWGSMG
jgi:hypothetical protein